jgi:RNA polymerase sigma-70 factor (ECF subfamily)
MALSSGARVDVASRADARGRLLAELAGTPARKGYGIAYDLLGNRAEAEEAVQEALARACESIGDLRDPAAAPAWYLRIVTTMCLRTLRRRRLKKKLFGWWPGKDDDTDAAPTGAKVSADTGTADIAARMHAIDSIEPREALADQQALAEMIGRLDDLSAQQRTALVLRYGHDLPVAEVAELLGVELATAKTHLVRGLARLRDLMEEHR